MPKLRISIVQYLNTAPLVWGFTNGPLQGKYDLSFTIPSQCAEALRSGAADVAIIPAIECQRIDNLVILPDMAVASKNRVRSLLLISKMPIERARRIALDVSSRSTQALTKILCDRRWKIAPEFFEMPPDLGAMLERSDAALLIGDPALRLSIAIESSAKRGPSGEQVCTAGSLGLDAAGAAVAGTNSEAIAATETLHIYDVVEEWRRMTGLPAVLAVWAARRQSVTPELIADFHASRDFGLAHRAEIAAWAAKELRLPADQLNRYLAENIDLSLDQENLKGLLHYYTLSASMGLIPQAKPLEIAAAPSQPIRHHDVLFAKPR